MAGAENYAGGGGNDWELVSLTASTYAAAPVPVQLPLDAIFMSQHFNLPPAEAHAIILNGCQEESTPAMADDGGDTDDLNIPWPESACETKMQGDSLTPCSDSHKNLFAAAGNALLQAAIVGVHTTQPDEYAGSDSTSVVHQVSLGSDNTAAVDSATLTTLVVPVAGAACVAPNKKGPSSSSESETPPREGHAWWNRTFSFLRSNSKESLTFRFIFVAATVVGLAILGQRDRLQLRLEFNVDGEKISCAVREPIGQVKLNMLVGGRPVGVTN